ncbi:predicted protein [Chaetomium globosum CBS 148.51]|uniref:Uncharacterized protein n=1 Tax=Chaetomium globosum (strain ATCC 6205 / CBS 148.51 / DSM 1962 / NBRC 6347 / NRRL 1970) TaxID=306901 RepID=Q2HA10_CHAGB|nr:uncharacterized protein CHGG_02944 [Chaetomium globosum CBS 148.51]EAQ91009.1 predicted protein [Chaetomium globosum CBS 148.51]
MWPPGTTQSTYIHVHLEVAVSSVAGTLPLGRQHGVVE